MAQRSPIGKLYIPSMFKGVPVKVIFYKFEFNIRNETSLFRYSNGMVSFQIIVICLIRVSGIEAFVTLLYFIPEFREFLKGYVFNQNITSSLILLRPKRIATYPEIITYFILFVIRFSVNLKRNYPVQKAPCRILVYLL